jgi:uncharacterized LabA/DUF88 family protein
MSFHPTDRIGLFIDGANLYSAARALNIDIDFRRLLDEFGRRGPLLRAYYYTAIVEDQDYSPIRPLVDWLSYNGFSVVTKPAKRYVEQATGHTRTKGDMDIEIAVDMLEMAPHIGVVEAVQAKGVKVTVVSTVKSQPPMASDELRRQADAFIDLAELANVVARPRTQTAPRFLQEPVGRERAVERDEDA